MFSGVIARSAGAIADALEAVEVDAGLAGILGVGLVVSVGTDVVA